MFFVPPFTALSPCVSTQEPRSIVVFLPRAFTEHGKLIVYEARSGPRLNLAEQAKTGLIKWIRPNTNR